MLFIYIYLVINVLLVLNALAKFIKKKNDRDYAAFIMASIFVLLFGIIMRGYNESYSKKFWKK